MRISHELRSCFPSATYVAQSAEVLSSVSRVYSPSHTSIGTYHISSRERYLLRHADNHNSPADLLGIRGPFLDHPISGSGQSFQCTRRAKIHSRAYAGEIQRLLSSVRGTRDCPLAVWESTVGSVNQPTAEIDSFSGFHRIPGHRSPPRWFVMQGAD